MPSSKWVEQLPPTSGVSDPQVRQFLDALANAWSLRNGNTGYTDEERFITKGEFDNLAQKAFLGYVSGAVGGVVGGPVGPRPPGNYEQIASSIVNSALYGLLNARIPEIRKPYELLSELDELLSNALSGVAVVRNKITRLTEESETSLREVRVLNTVYGQYDSLIFDSVQTTVGRAQRIEALKARYGSIESAITNINTVTVTSTSAAARAIFAMTATLGYDVRVFFNRAGANGAIVYQDPNPPSVLDAMRQPRLNDQWICPDAFGGEPEYTRRRWNGSAWVKGVAADLPANAGIAQERDARVRQDYANAQVIQSMWAAVTGLQANIEDGSVVVASGQLGVFAQRWSTLQAAVYESDGTTARVFQLRQDMFVGVLPNGQNPGWPGINNLQNLRGAWTVRLSANGVVGGFGMVMEENGTSTANNPSRVRFDFGVRADRFWIADPNAPNDAFDINKVPFAVVNGRTYINTAFIGEASIDTLRLAGNAVTLSSSNSGDSGAGSNSSSHTICSLSFQTGPDPKNIPSRVILVGVGNFLNNSGNGGELMVEINGIQAATSLNGGYSGCCSTVYHFDDMAPNQTYTFTLSAFTRNDYGPWGGAPTGRFYGHLILMGAKR